MPKPKASRPKVSAPVPPAPASLPELNLTKVSIGSSIFQLDAGTSVVWTQYINLTEQCEPRVPLPRTYETVLFGKIQVNVGSLTTAPQFYSFTLTGKDFTVKGEKPVKPGYYHFKGKVGDKRELVIGDHGWALIQVCGPEDDGECEPTKHYALKAGPNPGVRP